jgi:hypothetical protein
LQAKRQKLKKRKTKIQKLLHEQKLFNTLRAQIVDGKEHCSPPPDDKEDRVFDDLRASDFAKASTSAPRGAMVDTTADKAIVGGDCTTSKQTKFKTCVALALKQFALLRDLSAYDLQEDD